MLDLWGLGRDARPPLWTAKLTARRNVMTESHDTALARLDTARAALAECKTVMEAKAIADAAEMARVYLERTQASTDAVNRATEVRILAERQMGEFLAAMPKATGARMAGGTAGGTPVVTDGNRRETLADLGITKKQSAQAQSLAKLPKEELEERLAVAKAEGGKLTVSKVLPRTPPPPRASAAETVNPKTFGEVCADAIFAERVAMTARGAVMTKADVARVIDAEDAKRGRTPPAAAAPADVLGFGEARAAICAFRRYSDKPWRRESTKWSDKEAKALRALCPIPADDMRLMSEYYSANITPKDDIRRRDLPTLLNNWAGELDRARGWKAQQHDRPGERPKDYTRI